MASSPKSFGSATSPLMSTSANTGDGAEVIILDADEARRIRSVTTVTSLGYRVSHDSAPRDLLMHRASCICVDFELPGYDAVIEELQARWLYVSIIITVESDNDNFDLKKAVAKGCSDVLMHPLGPQTDIRLQVACATTARSEQFIAAHRIKVLREYIHSLAHDVGTPLTSMGLLMELVQEDQEDLQVQLSLMRELLELATYNAKRGFEFDKLFFNPTLEATIMEVDLRKVMQKCLRLLQHTSHSNSNVSLNVHISSDIPEFIYTDPNWMFDVMFAFVSNSKKFTEEGSVTLDISVVNSNICISVTDTGTGIAEDSLGNAFQPHGVNPQEAHAGGCGLGLFMVRKKVEALGGQCGVGPNLPKGLVAWASWPAHSCVRVAEGLSPDVMSQDDIGVSAAGWTHPVSVLPEAELGEHASPALQIRDAFEAIPAILALPQKEIQDPSETAVNVECIQAVEADALKILLIEDTASIRFLLSKALVKLGCTVVTAENGQQGLTELCHAEYSVVFCDVMMPIMDGFECVKRFRKWESEYRPGKHQHICCLTSQGTSECQDESIESGMDNLMHKPVQRGQLAAYLEGIITLS